MKFYKLLSIVLILIQSCKVFSQQVATITEKVIPIDTYFFDNPNPIPILADNPKIYPYFTFKGYQYKAKKKDWKVITLENDYIKLYVLPEIGGKIWGAIEKKTGEEFIYKNEVLKFRNIAMRGPWTSGGIEFNFGIIGHTPATATPVDYTIKNNDDGSISCIIGTIDLPSRTQWRVEINLQKDKAYFETKASWYNATPIAQSYYNWMTAAAAAKEDLEFFIPGNQFLKHNGKSKRWPIDKTGRKLSLYKNNNFSSHKSYHVVGDYKDFFGGYYHNTNFGFGHWAAYEEMPGQKLWLWALSHEGSIWEDLLTDTDGQYIEFQAGRLFNQYFPDTNNTPVTQANFDPYVMDRWSDIWFPFKEIKGMVDATKYGVLNVEHKNGNLYIGINALQELKETVTVFSNDTKVFTKNITLKPMEVFSKNITLENIGKLEVFVGDKLQFKNTDQTLIKRSFQTNKNLKISKSLQLYKEGWEAMKYREYDLAYQKLSELIDVDPSHQEALIKLAELSYRKTNYIEGLSYINRVLKMDTYHMEANYMAGNIYRALKDTINALESFGWSARDMKYRSVSYAQMAEIYLSKGNKIRAKEYAQKALDYNTYNINARQVLLIVSRKQNNLKVFTKQVKELLDIDPLHHFATIETLLINSKSGVQTKKINTIQNEFSSETILELAIRYYHLGLYNEALYTLSLSPDDIKIKLWIAYLLKNTNISKSNHLIKEVQAHSLDFVFPYRIETIPVLEWAQQQNTHWKFNYLLALNNMAIGLKEKGKQLLKLCKNEPNSAVFYSFRGKILNNESYQNRLEDYQESIQLNDKDAKLWNEFIQFNLGNNHHNLTYAIARKAYKKFPKNYDIALGYSKALVLMKKYKEALFILKKIKILPSEISRESRVVYYKASVLLANKYLQKQKYATAIQILEKSKEWPKNLGVGKPYDIDTRLQDYLLAICFKKRKENNKANQLLHSIIDYTNTHIKASDTNHLFGILSLQKIEKETNQTPQNRIIETLQKKSDEKSRLVLAIYNNDIESLRQLKEKNIVNESILYIMKSAMNY